MTVSVSLEWALDLEVINSIHFEALFFYCCTKYTRLYFHPNVHYFYPQCNCFLNKELERWAVFFMCACAYIAIFTVATILGDSMLQVERGSKGGGKGANIYVSDDPATGVTAQPFLI